MPVGDTIINVERPPAHLAKIDLDSIKYTPAGEKWPHKEQCACCRMYFHRESMITRVPNHRVLDMRKKMGVPMEGQRYSTASYLYANSKVCVLCTQLFDYPVEAPETPKSTSGSRVLNGGPGSSSSRASAGDDESVGSGSTASSVGSLRDMEKRFQRNSMLTPQKELIKEKMRKADAVRVGKYKLEIKTALKRANVAMLDNECRTYQSSIVDNMDSSHAVTIPYHAWSKTRREVDPWWEIDFGGRPRNIHSLSFLSNMASKENISIVVLMLKRPVGFENPFLDKVQGEAVQYREFELIPIEDGQDSSRYFWEIGSCTCEAVRVQLRGIKPLAVKEFKAFLGDDFVRYDEDKAKKIIHRSFATFSPTRQERALHSMLVESKKAIPVVGLQEDTAPKAFRGPNRDALFAKTAVLDQMVMQRYRKQQAWTAKTLRIINGVLGDTEIKALFYQVFACALLEEKHFNHDPAYLTTANMKQIGFALLGGGVKEAEVEREKEERKEREREKKRKEEEEMAALRAQATDAGLDTESMTGSTTSGGMTQGSPDGIPRMGTKSYDVDDDNISYHSMNSHGSMKRKEKVVDRDGALILHAAINMPEPRCSLASLHAKLRHVVLTIQSSGIHLKVPELVSLSQHARLAKICDDPNLSSESLQELRTIFDRVESVWDRQDDKAEKADRQKLEVKRSANMLRTGKMELSKEDVERERQAPRKAVEKTTRGTSWSQAVMAISLWVTGKSSQIPSSVFGVSLEEVHGSLFHAAPSGHNTPRSVRDDFEYGANTAELDGFGGSSMVAHSRSSSALPGGRGAGEGKGDEPPPGFLDTRFSEYKLGNFKRRFFSEPEFPASLNPKFSTDDLFREAKEKEKARLSAEWTAKIEEKRGKDESKKDEIKIIWPDEESEKATDEASATAAAAPATASLMPGSPMGGAGGPMSAIAAAAAKQPSPEKESGEFLGLPYVCGLCTKRFPYNSTNCKVMYKHIITIRREWDPKLVPKEMESLEQGTSMFNLSNICSFCAQFFDPDVSGGISYPDKNMYAKKKMQYTSDPKAESLVSKFFDSRYGLDANLDPTEFLHRPTTSKFRDTARFAIEVSQRIQEDKEMEEARVAAAKKLNEKGNSQFTEAED